MYFHILGWFGGEVVPRSPQLQQKCRWQQLPAPAMRSGLDLKIRRPGTLRWPAWERKDNCHGGCPVQPPVLLAKGIGRWWCSSNQNPYIVSGNIFLTKFMIITIIFPESKIFGRFCFSGMIANLRWIFLMRLINLMDKNRHMIDPEKKPFFDKLASYSKLSDYQSQIIGIAYDRRRDSDDRRKLHTFIANDRRSGIADRRKQIQ